MNVETAARYLDVPEERVRKLKDRRVIPYYQDGPGCRVFFRRAELGCIKCHALHKAGGNIGPDLGPIGGSSPMDYIVQSILDPNASIKEEYLPRTFVTSSGMVLNGIVSEKNKQHVILKDATGKKIKTPFFIHMKDRKPFAFAGLWDSWNSPDGALVKSCTIKTTFFD